MILLGNKNDKSIYESPFGRTKNKWERPKSGQAHLYNTLTE